MKFLGEVEKRIEKEDWKTLLLTYVKILCYTAMDKPDELESLFNSVIKKGTFVEIYRTLFGRIKPTEEKED